MSSERIEFDKDGFYYYIKPIHIFSDSPYEETSRMYQEYLKRAKDKRIYFKDQEQTRLIIFGNETDINKINLNTASYSIPTGYKLMIEMDAPIPMNYRGVDSRGDYLYYCPKCGWGGSYMGTEQVHCYKDECRQYAILVSIENKKPSIIDDAANEYVSNEIDPQLKLISKYSFRDGALWMEKNLTSRHETDVWIEARNCGITSQDAKKYWFNSIEFKQRLLEKVNEVLEYEKKHNSSEFNDWFNSSFLKSLSNK